MNVSNEPSFQRVFNQSGACLLLRVDGKMFTIAAVSDKYLRLTATKRDELLGKDAFDIFPDKEDKPDGAITTRQAILHVLKTAEEVIIPDYLYHIYSPISKQLEALWWKSTFEPILDEHGQVKYVLGTAVDQTSHHQTNNDLFKAEQMLHLAIEAGDIGTWSIDVETKAIISSSRSKSLYGLSENEFTTLEGILKAIHPDHREKVVSAINEAMVSDGTQSYVVDYPLIGIADKQERWVRSTAKVFLESGIKGGILCGTLIDITESKILEQKKNDFIMMVSHEMKTPLTAVAGYLDLVMTKAKKMDEGFIFNSLNRARIQTKKLNDMIVSFLDLASVEDGKLNLSKSQFPFSKLLKETVEDILPFSNGHKITFNDLPEIELYGDRAKIGQVIFNLLSNAIKYSPPDTTIELVTITVDSSLKFSVRDQGIGISPKHQKKLFDRFYRVDHSSRVKSGFGIGLYLASEIVKSHHGNIGVNSEEGSGSEFWFTLPLTRQD